MRKAICMKTDGNINEFEIRENFEINYKTIDHKIFPKSVRRTVGMGLLEKHHEFGFEGNLISFYAWKDGNAGDENKHEMPPPIDKDLLFGNSYLIAHNVDGQMINFTENEYTKFMNEQFQDFEDIASEDSWSEEESLSDDDSLRDFIVDDSCVD